MSSGHSHTAFRELQQRRLKSRQTLPILRDLLIGGVSLLVRMSEPNLRGCTPRAAFLIVAAPCSSSVNFQALIQAVVSSAKMNCAALKLLDKFGTPSIAPSC